MQADIFKNRLTLVTLTSSAVLGLVFTLPKLINGEPYISDLINFFWVCKVTILQFLFHFYLYPLLRSYLPYRLQSWIEWTARGLLSVLFGILTIWPDQSIHFYVFGGELPTINSHVVLQFRGLVISIIVNLIATTIHTLNRKHHTALENEKLKRQNTLAQFELLKQQINPHFLFNSLNILKTMVRSHDPNAEEYILRLSELYRNLLSTNQKDKVPLAEELEMLEHYQFMLNARFESKIVVSTNVKDESCQCLVPPFTLQLLLENCIKHNIASFQRPLLIEIFCDKGRLVVRNNFQPKRSVDASSQIGLENINRRFKMLTEQSIEIEQNEKHFTVYLPLVRPQKNTYH